MHIMSEINQRIVLVRSSNREPTGCASCSCRLCEVAPVAILGASSERLLRLSQVRHNIGLSGPFPAG